MSLEQGKVFKYVDTNFLFCRNYPSWLFVESTVNSSSDDVGSDPDLDCGEDEIEVADCTENNCVEHEDSSDSEDEGWYSLSRTDVRKLQDVRNTSEHVNIILTNPDILHLPQTSIFISESGICCEEDERNEESSPERTSYRYLYPRFSIIQSDRRLQHPLASRKFIISNAKLSIAITWPQSSRTMAF